MGFENQVIIENISFNSTNNEDNLLLNATGKKIKKIIITLLKAIMSVVFISGMSCLVIFLLNEMF